MSTRICPNCKSQFTKFHSRQKFCDDCKYVTITCHVCGKQRTMTRIQFEAPLPNNKPRTYFFCSVQCMQSVGNKVAAKKRENKVEIVCPNCGTVNRIKKAHERRKFCNQTCYYEYLKKHPEIRPGHSPSEKNMEVLRNRTGVNNPAYGLTGEKCVHWKGGREKYRGKGWVTIRKLIRRRDGEKCAICEVHKKVLSIHHIINWAEVQCNHPHNLITLCESCHQSRVHGVNKLIPDDQLLDFALKSTLAWSLQDDCQLIIKLDLQQRHGKGLPLSVVEKLSLHYSYCQE